MQEKMRLNKFISHNTNYSRREADELIKQGKVSINNKVVSQMAVSVSSDDKVKINGRFVKEKKDFTVIVYNKQKGELVTKKDDRGRKTIYDNLPRGFSKFVSIGRLDFASEGLLLLTDAPAIATALMNSDIEREYYLKIKGEITEEVKNAMREGFFAQNATKGAHEKSKITSMDFKPFVAFDIFGSSGGYTKLRVMINEGKNRELRRFFGYFDLEVVDLKRVSFGRVELGMLKDGKWRYFENREYEDLRDFLKQNGVRY
ncbi:23S rRNA pseudouridine 2605 synthase [Campylobacter pinnipediorum subsp. pinnipediorum]|nr:23S rRNA pseudouridine 2605 synthase [Campylobacter pinnipediorum subsp. pinnipediorum]